MAEKKRTSRVKKPQPAEEAPPAPSPEQPGGPGPTQVHVTGTGRTVQISEHAARILHAMCDRITVQGSESKFQLGIAQRELEQGLTALGPTPAQAAEAIAKAPPTRAARRRAAKPAKPTKPAKTAQRPRAARSNGA